MNSRKIAISVVLIALIIGSGGLWFYQTKNDQEDKDSIVKETNYEKEVKPREKNKEMEQVEPKTENSRATSDSGSNEPQISTKDEAATGYIKALFNKQGKNYMEIDYIQYFEGKDAINAIRQDKKSSGYDYSTDIPNGFYFRNNNTKIRSFQLSSDIKIKIRYEFETSATGEKTVSYKEFKNKYDSKKLYKEVPVDIIVKDGVVTQIDQKFIP